MCLSIQPPLLILLCNMYSSSLPSELDVGKVSKIQYWDTTSVCIRNIAYVDYLLYTIMFVMLTLRGGGE